MAAAAWDATREKSLKAGSSNKGDVLYWMARDQRAADNWALLRAAALAKENGSKARVVFALAPITTERRLDFQLKGLVETGRDLNAKGFAFDLIEVADDAGAAVAAFAAAHKVSHVVCDFSPLREAKRGTKALVEALPDSIGASLVDAHNIVPVWAASPKQEVGARTLRKKITDQLPRYLKELPELEAQGPPLQPTVDWRPVIKAARQKTDRSVTPVDWLTPGSKAASDALEAFCGDGRLKRFAKHRNDPNVEAASHLSPYLNFGQLSCQRAALRVREERSKHSESVASYLEEQIVRRELSDNFCHYQPHYDSLEGAAPWARDSLELHASDTREHLYGRDALEKAEAAEDVWNAAQRQLVRQGKMHGFMRMSVWKSTSASGALLGDGAAVLARSSGEEPASPRHRVGVASMAWRTTRRFSTSAP